MLQAVRMGIRTVDSSIAGLGERAVIWFHHGLTCALPKADVHTLQEQVRPSTA